MFIPVDSKNVDEVRLLRIETILGGLMAELTPTEIQHDRLLDRMSKLSVFLEQTDQWSEEQKKDMRVELSKLQFRSDLFKGKFKTKKE